MLSCRGAARFSPQTEGDGASTKVSLTGSEVAVNKGGKGSYHVVLREYDARDFGVISVHNCNPVSYGFVNSAVPGQAGALIF